MPVLPKSTRQVTTISGAVPNPKIGEGFNQAGYRAVENLGRIGENIADDLYKRNQDRQTLIDKSTYRHRMYDWKKILWEKQREFESLEYEKGLDVYKKSQEWLAKRKSDFIKNNVPDRISQAFSDGSLTADSEFFESISKHQAKEENKFHKSAHGATIESAKDEVYANPIDMKRVKRAIDRVNVSIDDYYGGDPKMKEQAEEDILSSMLTALVEQDDSISLTFTQGYFESIKDQLPKDLKDKFENKFRSRKKQLKAEEKIAEKAIRTEKDRMKKEEHFNAENEISKALNIEQSPVKAHKLLIEYGDILTGDEIDTWTDRIEKKAKGEKVKDPFDVSDSKYVDNIFKAAQDGLIDENELRPIPNKLSREDYRLAKGIAEMAKDPEKKYINSLMRSVITEAVERIKGDAYMYLGSEAQAIKDAQEAKRFIIMSVMRAKTDEEKMELLDQTSRKFILPLALEGKVQYEDKPKINTSSDFLNHFTSGSGTNNAKTENSKKTETISDKRLWE